MPHAFTHGNKRLEFASQESGGAGGSRRPEDPCEFVISGADRPDCSGPVSKSLCFRIFVRTFNIIKKKNVEISFFN